MDERSPDPSLTDGPLRRRWPLACISSTRCSTGLSVSSFLVPPCRGHVCQNWWWQTFGVRPREQIVSVALWWGWAKSGFPLRHGRCGRRSFMVISWKRWLSEFVCSVNVKENTPKFSYVNTKPDWLCSQDWPDCQTHITGVILKLSSTLTQAEVENQNICVSFIFYFHPSYCSFFSLYFSSFLSF